MAVQITDENLAQYLAQLSDSLENAEGARGCIVVTELDSMKRTLVIPGVNYNEDPITNADAVATQYVQIPFSLLADVLEAMQLATSSTITATNNANSATSAAQAATTGAEKVNAVLTGSTVTITNRNGISTSVNIGFEIYTTYTSVAAMNADAANVPSGKFVIIATNDPTDPDNAKLYAKNSQGSFTFLSDLDQASSAAWADWLENLKPQIEGAIATAGQDHTRAESDHTIATQDHTTAGTDHTTATQDHTTATGDHNNYTSDRQTFQANEAQRQQTFETNEATRQQTFEGDETQRQQAFNSSEQNRQNTFNTNEAQRQQDFEDAEAERMSAMVITRCFVDLSTMCLMFVQPEADTTQYKVRNGDLNITVSWDE